MYSIFICAACGCLPTDAPYYVTCAWYILRAPKRPRPEKRTNKMNYFIFGHRRSRRMREPVNISGPHFFFRHCFFHSFQILFFFHEIQVTHSFYINFAVIILIWFRFFKIHCLPVRVREREEERGDLGLFLYSGIFFQFFLFCSVYSNICFHFLRWIEIAGWKTDKNYHILFLIHFTALLDGT